MGIDDVGLHARGWLRYAPPALLWLGMLAAVVVGPALRPFDRDDIVRWGSLAIGYPIVVLGVVALRRYRLRRASQRETRVGDRVWLFDRSRSTRAAGGLGVPAEVPSPSGPGWLRVRGDTGEVTLGTMRGPARRVGTDDIAQVERLRGTVDWACEPAVRLVLTDGGVIDLRLVRAGLGDLIGVRRRDVRDVAETLGRPIPSTASLALAEAPTSSAVGGWHALPSARGWTWAVVATVAFVVLVVAGSRAMIDAGLSAFGRTRQDPGALLALGATSFVAGIALFFVISAVSDRRRRRAVRALRRDHPGRVVVSAELEAEPAAVGGAGAVIPGSSRATTPVTAALSRDRVLVQGADSAPILDLTGPVVYAVDGSDRSARLLATVEADGRERVVVLSGVVHDHGVVLRRARIAQLRAIADRLNA